MDCGPKLQDEHVVYDGDYIRCQGPAKGARCQAGGLCRQPPDVSTRNLDKRRERMVVGQEYGQQKMGH